MARFFLRAAPETIPLTERRSSTRYPAATGRLFRIESPDGATLAHGVLENASATGVRLLTARACMPGPAVLVPLPPHALAGRRFPFKVERVSAQGGGGASIAGPFEPPISDGEARALAEVTP